MKKNNNKIAILADIHSMYPLLKTVIKDIHNRNIEAIVFLGDYVTDGFENNKVLDIIKKYENVIAGNRDVSVANYDGFSWENTDQFINMLYAYNELTETNLQYLKKLPEVKIITLGNKKICLSHGSPYNNRDAIYKHNYVIFDKLINDYNCDIYLFGHTHLNFYTKYKNKLFINPGSIALSSDLPLCKYGILDIKTLKYEQVSISYNFNKIMGYYLSSDYFKKNFTWANLLLHTYRDSHLNDSKQDYCCGFIDYIINKAKKENINITKGFSNKLWNESFELFMKQNNLEIYTNNRKI